MHDEISGIYIPPSDYCACHALPDEWIKLIPNLIEYSEKLENLIILNKSTSENISLENIR